MGWLLQAPQDARLHGLAGPRAQGELPARTHVKLLVSNVRFDFSVPTVADAWSACTSRRVVQSLRGLVARGYQLSEVGHKLWSQIELPIGLFNQTEELAGSAPRDTPQHAASGTVFRVIVVVLH